MFKTSIDIVWDLLSVFTFSPERQEKVITAWFVDHKKYYKITKEISEVSVFLDAFINYKATWMNEFFDVDEVEILFGQMMDIYNTMDKNYTTACLYSKKWKEMCYFGKKALEVVGLEANEDVCYIDYGRLVELVVNENYEIIAVN
ncbi:hypothetical protein [Acinetobacter sp. TR11]|uniref:hypothetical protein n=1 Tax=Acinetobacter sp. TR11 TaxID=3003393 RepID=UPI0022ABD697|nr:hypothetical protein [Acinetobacter sp. TR11]WAU72729.1 hypothetical protein O1450_11580 [Acinetobacter sp. TR11]